MTKSMATAAALALALSFPAWTAARADDGVMGDRGLLEENRGPLLGDEAGRPDNHPLVDRDGVAERDSLDERRDQLYGDQEDLGEIDDEGAIGRDGGILDDEEGLGED